MAIGGEALSGPSHLDGAQMRDAIRGNQRPSAAHRTWMVPGKRFAAPTERQRSPIARSRTAVEAAVRPWTGSLSEAAVGKGGAPW
jgi:hypothetical protein